MPVKHIPDGYHSVTPYLVVSDAKAAIEFYRRAFGATERFRLNQPDGRVGHAELDIGDSAIMLADEFPEMNIRAPQAPGAAGVSLHVYVADVDASFAQALAAGAQQRSAVTDQFYGDRTGSVIDPYGHVWHLATHKEDLTQAEIDARFRKLYG